MKLPDNYSEKGFVPGQSSMPSAATVYLGMGLIFGIAAVGEWLSPSRPPFSGKGSLIQVTLYELLGPSGLLIFFCSLTFVSVVAGFFCLAERFRQTG